MSIQFVSLRLLVIAAEVGCAALLKRRFETDEAYAESIDDEWYGDGQASNGWALHRANLRQWAHVAPQA